MESVHSEALVLRKVAYGEADLIITLLAREVGRLSARARSARRSRRRFAGALELFTVSKVELRPGGRQQEMWTLASADVSESFAELAREVGCLSHASYGTELVRELLAPEQPEPGLFDLLVELYRTLSRRGARVDVLRVFELALLGELGLAPLFDACAACGRRDSFALDRGAVLDPGRGGAICSACAAASRAHGVRPLAAGARALLVAAQAAVQSGDLASVELATGDAATGAREAMLALLSHHIGHPLRTLEFIEKMNRPVT